MYGNQFWFIYLDMLTVEERQNSLKHSIELDHCYTSRLSPAQPKPADPLPITHSPERIEVQHAIQTTPISITSTASPILATTTSGSKLPVRIFVFLNKTKNLRLVF